MDKKRVGFIVNPIAGMGGSVGLKGTDGDIILKARELGAQPVSPDRSKVFLSNIVGVNAISWFAAPGSMGADYLAFFGLPFTTVGNVPAETIDQDTIRVAREMLAEHIDLLVFVGGDGTARDIHEAVGMQVPVVAVPAGVKVYSAAFALSPRAAANMVDAYIQDAGSVEKEVLDIDEDAYRANRLEVHFVGYLLVPDVMDQIQPGKEGTQLTINTLENQRDIAAGFVEEMDCRTLYLLGPGTTVKAIADAMKIQKTLLGVDAVVDSRGVGTDLNENDILALLDRYEKSAIVLTPLGGNGFIFGRGNKQFTPQVIRWVGKTNLIFIATEEKLRNSPVLRVDTGDVELDNDLAGYGEVMVGYRKGKVVKILAV
jgi:predicted polyphosphate/ATP-dependent NAD kinase